MCFLHARSVGDQTLLGILADLSKDVRDCCYRSMLHWMANCYFSHQSKYTTKKINDTPKALHTLLTTHVTASEKLAEWVTRQIIHTTFQVSVMRMDSWVSFLSLSPLWVPFLQEAKKSYEMKDYWSSHPMGTRLLEGPRQNVGLKPMNQQLTSQCTTIPVLKIH